MGLFGWLFTGTYADETFPDHPTGDLPPAGPFDNLSDEDQMELLTADFEAAAQANVTGAAESTEATAEAESDIDAADAETDADADNEGEGDSDGDGEGDGGDSEGGGEK